MSRVRSWSNAGTAIVLLLMLSGPTGTAQQGTFAPPGAIPQRPATPDPSRPLGDTGRSDDPISGRIAEQQARNRNSDRQKKLVADTDKLLALATELKQEVDKTDKNTLSVDVVKKADEIEKLAHSVKEKMRGGA